MCGICGIIKFDGREPDAGDVRTMMKHMKHRGPDDEGVFLENEVALGFVRLSIIDLSPGGHQPMYSGDKRFVIVFNGEIYNYLEIREELQAAGHHFSTKSDTEVLLKAYQVWGNECLHKLNGMWAFAIYDRKEKTVFCSRDRFGVKPFYYCLDNDQFVFASEIPPLLGLCKSAPEPDYQSVYDYLVFNRTDHTSSTFFNGVKKLQHSHSITIRLNKKHAADKATEINRWYDLRAPIDRYKEDKGEFRELFISSAGIRLRSDVPVGVCLSGGLDSSSIVSVLTHYHKMNDLKTFSAVYKKGQDGDESEFIDEFRNSVRDMSFTSPSASSLFSDMYTFIKAHAEPVPSTAPYAQFKVMELARSKVVVTLDGQGADELLAGYHYFFGIYFRELLTGLKVSRFFTEAWNYLKKHRSSYAFLTLLFFMLPSRAMNRVRTIHRGYLSNDFIKKHSSKSTISTGLYSSRTLKEALVDHFEYKLEHLLKWEDRNSMWFSIEARVPFLDYRLVEHTMTLPPGEIISKGFTKKILRDAMSGIIPDKIKNRTDKVGFDTPQGEWFREKFFVEFINELFSSESLSSRKIIDIEKAKKLYSRHLSGKIDISKDIWKWINLELWFREFIDKKQA